MMYRPHHPRHEGVPPPRGILFPAAPPRVTDSTQLLRLMRLSIATALFLAAAPATAIHGQEIPSVYRFIENGQEAGVFVGNLTTRTGTFDLGPRSGLMVGGRYTVELGGPAFLEGLLGFFPTDRDVIDPRRAEGDRSLGTAPVRLFSIDARLGFSLTGRRTWRGVSPYLFAGGGLAFDSAPEDPLEEALLSEDRFDFGSSFTGHFGAGVRYALSDRLMLRSDLSVALWQLSTPTGFDAPEKNLGSVPENEWVGGTSITIGVGWRF